ncbi:DUF6959 family protein [Streptomyces sp. 900105755]|uniref:DUF6959 family protein n=1 Tax=Streptomyces sp. Ag109_O5-10 TaxID=1855349 RepID=UPI00089C6F8F|nr:hypothetical protein [Streptomyces sp. Ag109_O5-10]SEF13429.1 hypothetical protein SAMN05216533_6804 [Streptomyces sp. Ag109_O5-10]
MTDQEHPATVLAVQGNFSVVHVQGRRYPALAVQGDSLKVLQEAVEGLAADLASGELEDAKFSLGEIREQLSSMLAVYETALGEAGLGLPYVR